MILTLLILIPFPMLFAVLINNKFMWGREFSSHPFSSGTDVGCCSRHHFRLMFGEMEGSLINSILGWFGIDPVKFLKGQVTGFIALVALATWRWTGVNMLYFYRGSKHPGRILRGGIHRWGFGLSEVYQNHDAFAEANHDLCVNDQHLCGACHVYREHDALERQQLPENIGLTIVGYLYRQGIEKNNLGYAAAVGIVAGNHHAH